MGFHIAHACREGSDASKDSRDVQERRARETTGTSTVERGYSGHGGSHDTEP